MSSSKPQRWLPWLLLAVALGCSPSQSANPTGGQSSPATSSISAVATVGMVADLVRQVGGDRVTVTQLMGSGVDPHLYKATRDDVNAILQSDITFYCGLMLEGKMTDTLIKVARDKPVIAVTEGLDESRLLEPQEMQGHYDPHVWMDVSAWSECVDRVADALVELDRPHADQYLENAATYKVQLDALHQYAKETLASIPESSRILITSHDAFNYFGRAYGLEVQGIQGLSTESEAGLQRINELVDLLVSRKIQAVFVESSVPRKNIDSLIEGARAKGHPVMVGGELYSDAMGPSGTYEGTYLGMLDHNITSVARALSGQAPEHGLHGKLSSQQASGQTISGQP